MDILSGQVDEVDLAGYGEQLNAPYLAGALWQQPLGASVAPQETTDPRRPWRRGGAGALAAAAGTLVVRRRRSVRRLPRARG